MNPLTDEELSNVNNGMDAGYAPTLIEMIRMGDEITRLRAKLKDMTAKRDLAVQELKDIIKDNDCLPYSEKGQIQIAIAAATKWEGV